MLNSFIKEKAFEHAHKELIPILIQSLHILQPRKFPGFSFAWLKLLSHQGVLKSIEYAKGTFTTLLQDLFFFFQIE